MSAVARSRRLTREQISIRPVLWWTSRTTTTTLFSLSLLALLAVYWKKQVDGRFEPTRTERGEHRNSQIISETEATRTDARNSLNSSQTLGRANFIGSGNISGSKHARLRSTVGWPVGCLEAPHRFLLVQSCRVSSRRTVAFETKRRGYARIEDRVSSSVIGMNYYPIRPLLSGVMLAPDPGNNERIELATECELSLGLLSANNRELCPFAGKRRLGYHTYRKAIDVLLEVKKQLHTGELLSRKQEFSGRVQPPQSLPDAAR